MQLGLAFVDLYIYGPKEVGDSGHGLHLWVLDLYLVFAGIEILGDILEWILEKLVVSNVFKLVIKESRN